MDYLLYRRTNYGIIFDSTLINVDLAQYEIFYAKVGIPGIKSNKPGKIYSALNI